MFFVAGFVVDYRQTKILWIRCAILTGLTSFHDTICKKKTNKKESNNYTIEMIQNYICQRMIYVELQLELT